MEEVFDFGLMDLGFEGMDPVAGSNKLDGNDDEAAALDPDNDADDGEEKLPPSQQNLSKKERKA